jgi:hypothetical protein
MEVLKLVTEYYTLSVQTSNPQRSWKRFESRLHDKALTYCDYISSSIGTLWLSNFESDNLHLINQLEIKKWEEKHPVFFETNTYNFALEFTGISGKPTILHPNKAVADLFSYFPIRNGGILTGSINFLNEPGKFTLSFTYDTPTHKNRIDHFTFDVVSPKLDTKDDYKSIVETINKEYNELVYKYLTLTFQQFGKKGKTNNELIWLAIFQEIIGGYLQACNYIVNKPHFKKREDVYFQKPDHIKRWTPRMEELYKEKATELDEDISGCYFRNEFMDNTINTKENQFVKYTIQQFGKKLHTVIKQLEINYKDALSEEYKTTLSTYGLELDRLIHHKMFSAIDKFKGFRQESIVLQKRTGYAQVYRYWLMLQSGLSLFDGTTNIGMKQIWELYELWCFLKMKEMIGSFEGIDLLVENKESMLKPFSEDQVQHCVTYLNSENGDKIELRYQHTYKRNGDETHTATTEQRPDIVLNIQKANSEFVLTYLYDAKYRVLDDKNQNTTDTTDEPVPDAINQMHRYRDAIYYGQSSPLSAKEIIGAYVLFPGRGEDEGIRKKYFHKSIETINIGAFPLLPNSNKELEGSLLREHLKMIILDKSKHEQLINSIPQKGLVYESESDANVFVAVVNLENRSYQSFVNRTASIYYTGRKFPSTLNILSFKYFAPYYDGGIREYYEIIGIRSAKKTEIEKYGEAEDDGVRFFFELGKCFYLSNIPKSMQLIFDTYQVISLVDLSKVE